MAKFTIYEIKSGKKHRCEGADVKELTGGDNAFYTSTAPKAKTEKKGKDGK